MLRLRTACADGSEPLRPAFTLQSGDTSDDCDGRLDDDDDAVAAAVLCGAGGATARVKGATPMSPLSCVVSVAGAD